MALSRKEIEEILTKNKDYSSLTVSELEQVVKALEESRSIKNTTQANAEAFAREVVFPQLKHDSEVIHNVFYPDAGYLEAARYVARGLLGVDERANPLTFAEKLESAGGKDPQKFEYSKRFLGGLETSVTPKIASYQASETPAFPESERNLKTAQDVLSTLKEKEVQSGVVQDYLTKLPEQLTEPREKYLQGLENVYSEQYKQNIVPQVEQLQNIRGTIFSGDLTDALSQEAVNIQGDLNSIRQELEQSDDELYFNAAYQQKVQQLLEANTDYRSAIENERANVLTRQNQDFQASQNKISSDFNMRMLERQQQRQEAAQAAQLRKQQQAQEGANRKALIGTIGSVAGGVAGAYAGGPVGAMAGSQAGSSLGELG